MRRTDIVFCAVATLWLVVIASSGLLAARLITDVPLTGVAASFAEANAALDVDPSVRAEREAAIQRHQQEMLVVKREEFVQRANGFATLLLLIAGVFRIRAWSKERFRSLTPVPPAEGDSTLPDALAQRAGRAWGTGESVAQSLKASCDKGRASAGEHRDPPQS